MVKFLIVSSGYNCEPLAHKCIASVLKQSYTNWNAVFISDGSNDGTLKLENIPRELHDNRIWIELNPDNCGAAKRRYDAIKTYADNEDVVVLLLGLDDELMPDCLQTIAKQYEQGKWMTYGNWVDQTGWKLPHGFLNFKQETHDSRDYRKVEFRSTAPNTFKRFLFDMIPIEDFQIDGRWIDSTTESELMFSCLEMCGQSRIGVIEQPIYLYNRNLPGGTLKRLGVKYKYDIYAKVIAREKKPLLIRP